MQKIGVEISYIPSMESLMRPPSYNDVQLKENKKSISPVFDWRKSREVLTKRSLNGLADCNLQCKQISTSTKTKEIETSGVKTLKTSVAR